MRMGRPLRPLLLFTLLTALVACTTAHVPPGNSPAKPELIEQPLFRAGDGTELALMRWQPAGKPRAVLLMLHGFNEYSGAGSEPAEVFRQQGIAVWALDQRGFGRSPYRGLWSSAERMAEDVRELTALIRNQYPGLPVYVLGHSMGGAVALLAAGAGTLQADGIILAAPAVWIRETQPFYQRWGLELSRKYFPGWSPTGESLQIRPTDNIAAWRRLWQSPWMIRQSRIDTVAGLVELMDKGYAAAPNIKLPVLLLYGDKDQLVPKKPVDMLWAHLNKTGKTRQIRYPNGWHMLLRDLQGGKVIADVVQWMLPEKHGGD